MLRPYDQEILTEKMVSTGPTSCTSVTARPSRRTAERADGPDEPPCSGCQHGHQTAVEQASTN